ncbi:hypothetical protein C8N43_3796 [Litoreibacter ponti]|uniref:Histidine phosphatase superfamily protein (Branch 1) n=1 Tax=Litoreibacter ponti TaxID=1510457 RepID=A0A2T6BFY7_9RHOB|nr:hypothetical protein [Litoreibacter ponti]PTX54967.1 hypothetical protein C8N43_3796 [Litoreibacter ponti]
MNRLNFGAFAVCAAFGASAAFGQTLDIENMKVKGKMEQVSTHMGSMTIELGENAPEIDDRLIFEPFQMNDELQQRTDLVFLMRHGPTDWSKLDVKNVAPTDCANQRIMSPEGRKDMETLGLLLGSNLLLPSKIIVSEWCRNQQTLESLNVGFDQVADDLSEAFVVETNPELNLLLSLQGAEDVEELRRIISAWDGTPPEGSPYAGRLLIITHFTNIEELTNFQVFEGEILVVDPKRDNRVIGYLRLASASPDVGHFNQ